MNPGDFDKKSTPHIDVRTGPGQHFVFTIECDGKVNIMIMTKTRQDKNEDTNKDKGKDN